MSPISARGFTLLEVLVSLLLLSIALLELDVVGFFSLQQGLNNYYDSVALQQIRNLEQRLSLLGAGEGLEEQREAWEQENQELLPQPKAELWGTYPLYSLKLCWGKKPKKISEEPLRCRVEELGIEEEGKG